MPAHSKKLDEVINAVDEALTEISKDHTNILKALNKIADRLNELSTRIDVVADRANELYKLYEALEDKIMNTLGDLEKIRKSLYWHRQTMEGSKKGRQYTKKYGTGGKKKWR
mgnify:FL=1